ncbi:MAG: methylmalonyl Co-A mutase-associated GTPase MeaB [Bacteroidetes bacterium]|nr:methylmalonyl Co-A mutase-associated GTPase MeaB [Bacteroidota bacterium]MDA0903811.1 methylmalonyl Co-A mutase-associated GTPase MeaB [Bacteroidota bacterium]MDA1242509.1 methylmalonyl Co-A mutase-associated GTPase MeaB [Bacteroidota bacterium]
MPVDPSRSQQAKVRAQKAAMANIQGSQPPGPADLAAAVMSGKREALAQAITWVESNRAEDLVRNAELLQHAQPTCESIRIGVTGIPGAGKSTWIEKMGMDALARGYRVAVLAIDPSSQRTGGSLLGDKTRMNQLSQQPRAFVRPSPSSNVLGGVTRATAEAIQLCEAAGYNFILVETVGVGQSETSVRTMVDLFMLLLIGGAGDEVQGIKRGVVEMADVVIIHKADGDALPACRSTAVAYSQALHVLPTPPSGSAVEVLLASSITGEGHPELWAHIQHLVGTWKDSGWWVTQRAMQRNSLFEQHAKQILVEVHMNKHKELYNKYLDEVRKGVQGPFEAARRWIASHESNA